MDGCWKPDVFVWLEQGERTPSKREQRETLSKLSAWVFNQTAAFISIGCVWLLEWYAAMAVPEKLHHHRCVQPAFRWTRRPTRIEVRLRIQPHSFREWKQYRSHTR